jgi:hypothetical protein
MSSSDATVTLYSGGKKTQINQKAGELIASAEAQLRSADAIIRLAVTPELIRNLQTNGTALEIRYGKPKFFVLSIGRTIEAQRLLIPLSGELSGEITTIFYGGPSSYVAGPYRNKKGTAEITKLVSEIGYQLK